MTRKFLVIGTRLPHASAAVLEEYARSEMEAVWKQYLAGFIREMYQRDHGAGVVMVMEAPSAADIEKMVADWPLKKAGLIEMQVIGLQPFGMLSNLFERPVGLRMGDSGEQRG